VGQIRNRSVLVVEGGVDRDVVTSGKPVREVTVLDSEDLVMACL
jgi:hypothetical protein